MKKSLLGLCFILPITLSSFSHAASLDIEWQNAEEYRDVKPNGMLNKSKHREHVLKVLTEHLTKLTAKLPEKHQLAIQVTNLDLAGEVRPIGSEWIRVIKSMYIPRIELSYQLTDAQGRVYRQEEALKIKDMNFDMGVNRYKDSEPYKYELAMLDDWFQQTFPLD